MISVVTRLRGYTSIERVQGMSTFSPSFMESSSAPPLHRHPMRESKIISHVRYILARIADKKSTAGAEFRR